MGSAAMWNSLGRAVIVLMLLILAGCNDDNAFFDDNGTGTDASADSITLLASSPQLGSSGSDLVTITAIVKDDNNNLLSGVSVVFTSNSGSLAVTQSTTDDSGEAIATLDPGGDFTNRTITVTATVGSLSETVDISVTGTSLAISGENSATLAGTTALIITLTDSDGDPISGKTLTVSSSLGNTLSAASLTTSSIGQATLNVTAVNAGTDTITASAQGATSTHTLTISGDQFQMTEPVAGADIPIYDPIDPDSCAQVQVSWQKSSTPVVGSVVSFSATRGTLYSDAACTITATSATTNPSGIATMYVSSTNAGPSTLTAYVTNGPTTSRSVNFVATTPDSIALQASPTTIGPNDGSQTQQQRSTLTAVIRDASNNLVANKVVRFSIIQDNSGGTLTTATATTDSLGRASTSYVSSAATTAQDGVVIRAAVDEDPAINVSIALTVAQSSLFVRLGTGNEIEVPSLTTYRMPYTVMVTDASGNAADNTTVNISVNPLRYGKGSYSGPGAWVITYDGLCTSEDLILNDPQYDLNGVLDAGEDLNSDGILTPGNVASAPSPVTTGSDGTFEFGITYPQEYANWVEVELVASTTVAGTESRHSVVFWLPIAADELEDDPAPPGVVSPFGTGACP
jgi:hypothetical protein